MPRCENAYSWLSPELMVRKVQDLSEIKTCGDWVLWCEKRPEEAGRSVIIGYLSEGKYHDLTPPGSDVGTQVNEYGGNAWAARLCSSYFEEAREDSSPPVEIIFNDRKKSGLWRSRMGQKAIACMSPEGKDYQGRICQQFYADLSFGGTRKEKLVAIRENRPLALPEKPENITQEIVCFDLTKGAENSLHEEFTIKGADFYASPSLSPCGHFLAWIAWHNPHMPWTATEICVVNLARPEIIYRLSGPVEAGRNVSVMEPLWQGQHLYILSDEQADEQAGGWTPIRFDLTLTEDGTICWERHNLPSAPVEIGFPHWVFGRKSYVVLAHGGILARGSVDLSSIIGGQTTGKLIYYSPQTQKWSSVSEILGPETISYSGQAATIPEMIGAENMLEGCFAWLSAPEDAPPVIMCGALNGPARIIRQAWFLPEDITPEDISRPVSLSFPIEDAGEMDKGHALFYPPASGRQTIKQSGEKPPLVTLVHGGPTAQAQDSLSFKVQWWTSRGFAVLDVNYRGSTGFGRAYREALDGQWGVRDGIDCCAAVAYVQKKGWVDPKRCVIRGSSAGGLTVLSALAQPDGLFVAGTSLYGVTDLRALTAETHRFEAYYLTSLIADPTQEGAEEIYLARSPSQWPEKIRCPVLFLHGGQDKIVPLSHAEALAQRLDHCVFHVYPQEGHGFRTPEIIGDSLQRELDFYQKVFSGSDFVS